jgi:hypothetical protein
MKWQMNGGPGTSMHTLTRESDTGEEDGQCRESDDAEDEFNENP